MKARPTPYVPLSISFATGRTGTAIVERFGYAGLGVWAAMLAAGGASRPQGQIFFCHDEDWAAIGLDRGLAPFALGDFLRFLGQRKQTRTTRQGRTIYLQITQWERWNEVKATEQARRRKARSRAVSKRDNGVTPGVTESGQERDPEVEVEVEEELTTERLQDMERRRSGFELPVLRDVS